MSETPPISLRPVLEADLETLYLQQDDPEANRMAAFPARDRASFMTHWHRIMSDPDTILRTILYEGRVAGSLVVFGPANRRLVGYWIGRAYWNRGIASAALTMLLKEVEERPLHAHVAQHNVGSIRVLEKAGFEVIAASEVTLDATRETIGELVMRLYPKPPL
jgi:RimJ/RimL family protein N-acetyltransferase